MENGSAGATGRRCRYKLAASGGSAGCVRQLEAPIWLTPIAGGYETARKRRFFNEKSLWRCVARALWPQELFARGRDRFFYSGGILSDVSITPDKMEDFLKNNDQTFKLIADEYIKKMS